MSRALRYIALAVAAVLAGFVMGGLAVTGYASAWGDGRICWQGQTYSFQDEASYYQFLNSHPGATEGSCVPTTTTTGATTSTTTSTTTAPSTSAPTSTSTSSTSSPPGSVTTPSTPSSTPSASPPSVPPSNDMMCASSTNSDISSATSSGCGLPSTAMATSTSTPQSPSQTSAQPLPATGSDVTGWLIAAITALAIGGGAVLIARKPK